MVSASVNITDDRLGSVFMFPIISEHADTRTKIDFHTASLLVLELVSSFLFHVSVLQPQTCFYSATRLGGHSMFTVHLFCHKIMLGAALSK